MAERGVKSDVTPSAALEFRREQYGLSVKEFSFILGLERSHYNEVINGKREITVKAMRKAAAIFVVPEALLSQPDTQRG